MQSDLPKVLHSVGGQPMLARVVRAIRTAGITDVVVVAPPESDVLREHLPTDAVLAVQPSPVGTGDAVRFGLEQICGQAQRVIVVGGDTPLISAVTIRAVAACVPPATVALAAALIEDPTGYGRLVLGDGLARVLRIVEEADASAEELALRLVNGMVFAFDAAWLRDALPRIEPSPSGEIYLTGLIARAASEGREVRAVEADDPWEIMGVNTRRQLALAEAALRNRVNNALMDHGVSLVDPSSTYVEESVVVGRDVVIEPGCYLRGMTLVEEGSIIGPSTHLIDARVGRGSHVWWSVVEGATIGQNVQVGPYARVRPGTTLENRVALGSFAEVKNSHIGAGTQIHHFSYLGDADVGPHVNVGAGAVTCNFDGVEKHRTVIGAGAFIGSDTMLIAPVSVGENAMTGAGSVVTHDVAPNDRVAGVPARSIARAQTRER